MTIPNVIDMQESGVKSSREHQTVKPVYLRKLSAKFPKATDVADILGVSSATISKDLRDDETSVAREYAAQFVYERDFPEGGGTKAKPVCALIQGELHQVRTIKDMIEALGGKFTFIDV